MKKLMIVLAILLIPAVAMAGMSAMSKKDLQTVKGQTGITIIAQGNSLTATRLAWGDADGFVGATAAGWLVLNSLTLPGINTGIDVDIFTDATNALGMGTGSYLRIDPLGPGMLTGTLAVGGIYVGDTSGVGADAERLGELIVTGVVFSPGTLYIRAHP